MFTPTNCNRPALDAGVLDGHDDGLMGVEGSGEVVEGAVVVGGVVVGAVVGVVVGDVEGVVMGADVGVAEAVTGRHWLWY
jgi:hypothetical protein